LQQLETEIEDGDAMEHSRTGIDTKPFHAVSVGFVAYKNRSIFQQNHLCHGMDNGLPRFTLGFKFNSPKLSSWFI